MVNILNVVGKLYISLLRFFVKHAILQTVKITYTRIVQKIRSTHLMSSRYVRYSLNHSATVWFAFLYSPSGRASTSGAVCLDLRLVHA